MTPPSHAQNEQPAARLHLAVHHVLSGLVNGIIDTMVTPDSAGMGDIDHAEMVLTEVTPVLVARHAVLLAEVRAGLGDARVQRRKAAWDRLVPCLDALAGLSGAELPPIPAAAPYPPTVTFRAIVAPEPLTARLSDGPVVFLARGHY